MTTPRSRYWLPEPQDYAVTQEQTRHADALYHFGEFVIFTLIWRRADFDAGLVRACLRCVVPGGRMADVYQQPSDGNCPVCFATGYQGGIRTQVVRPSMWDYTETADAQATRGNVLTQSASVQTTADFKMRTGDLIFRQDGSRWQVRTLASNHLRTGFGKPGIEGLGYNLGTVTREDENSVSYLMPPTPAVVKTTLAVDLAHPPSFAAVEIKNAPYL